MVGRLLTHLMMPAWTTHWRFPVKMRDEITTAITESESEHTAQIRFAVESSWSIRDLLRGETPRTRALEVFGSLGVWDTAANNGVLIYLCLADHDVEIVADRGFDGVVNRDQWESVCMAMESELRAGQYGAAALTGIAHVHDICVSHFPDDGEKRENELSNQPRFV